MSSQPSLSSFWMRFVIVQVCPANLLCLPSGNSLFGAIFFGSCSQVFILDFLRPSHLHGVGQAAVDKDLQCVGQPGADMSSFGSTHQCRLAVAVEDPRLFLAEKMEGFHACFKAVKACLAFARGVLMSSCIPHEVAPMPPRSIHLFTFVRTVSFRVMCSCYLTALLRPQWHVARLSSQSTSNLSTPHGAEHRPFFLCLAYDLVSYLHKSKVLPLSVCV